MYKYFDSNDILFFKILTTFTGVAMLAMLAVSWYG